MKTARLLGYALLAFVIGILTPAVTLAQTGLAIVTGIVSDEAGGAVPGVTVTATNQATNIAYTGVTNEAGNYIITSVPIGGYVISVELQGFKSVQSTVTLSAAQTARVDFKLELGARRGAGRGGRDAAPCCRPRTRSSATIVERDQVEKLPAAGTEPVGGHALHGRRDLHESQPVRQLRGGGRPAVNGQRAAGQQLHGRRHRLERGDQQRHRVPAEPRRRGTGQRRDEQLLGRARQRRRRRRQHGDQVGDEPVPRERVRLLARQQAGGDAVGHQPRGRHEVEVLAQHLRRHAWRAARCATSCSSSGTTRAGVRTTRRRILRDRRARRVAAGRSQQPAREEHHHPRSADRPAVPEQPDSGQPVQHSSRAICSPTRRCIRVRTSRVRSATSAQNYRGYDRVGAGRGPVRREGRLERLGQRTSCTCGIRGRRASRRRRRR